MFSIFQHNRNGHLRRIMTLLEEANLARIEHQAAAEHHGVPSPACMRIAPSDWSGRSTDPRMSLSAKARRHRR